MPHVLAVRAQVPRRHIASAMLSKNGEILFKISILRVEGREEAAGRTPTTEAVLKCGKEAGQEKRCGW